MKNEIDQTVERIAAIYSDKPIQGLFVATEKGSQEIVMNTDELKALANAHTQLKADLATAKQGLEHYADTATWANWQPVRSGIIKAVRYSPNGTLQNKDPNGYDLAQQTLDKIGKE